MEATLISVQRKRTLNGCRSIIIWLRLKMAFGWQRNNDFKWKNGGKYMSNYLLYDLKMIEDDSCMDSFARSLLRDLDKDYEIERGNFDNEEEYKDEIMEAVYNSIHDDLSRTDIDYINLMEKYAKDIGQLLYDLENHSYDLSAITLSFFDQSQKSFETLLYKYIEIHFEELSKVCLCQ